VNCGDGGCALGIVIGMIVFVAAVAVVYALGQLFG